MGLPRLLLRCPGRPDEPTDWIERENTTFEVDMPPPARYGRRRARPRDARHPPAPEIAREIRLC